MLSFIHKNFNNRCKCFGFLCNLFIQQSLKYSSMPVIQPPCIPQGDEPQVWEPLPLCVQGNKLSFQSINYDNQYLPVLGSNSWSCSKASGTLNLLSNAINLCFRFRCWKEQKKLIIILSHYKYRILKVLIYKNAWKTD